MQHDDRGHSTLKQYAAVKGFNTPPVGRSEEAIGAVSSPGELPLSIDELTFFLLYAFKLVSSISHFLIPPCA